MIIPTTETVKQNYFLDLAIANCIPLGNISCMLFFGTNEMNVKSSFCTTYFDFLCFHYSINFYMYNLGISGPSGTGKSFLTNVYVRKLSKEKFITNVINFSARTSTNYTQDVIMSKLDRRRKGVFGPAMGKKCIVFVDDVNLPQVDDVGSIPAVELLRQVSFRM